MPIARMPVQCVWVSRLWTLQMFMFPTFRRVGGWKTVAEKLLSSAHKTWGPVYLHGLPPGLNSLISPISLISLVMRAQGMECQGMV
jgi:hypothetical protein